jgi:hypothetical protein
MNHRYAIATTLAAGAVGLAACSGGSFSGSPTPSDTVGSVGQSVSPIVLNASVLQCEEGFAHPNVCCATAPGEGSACKAYPDSPFQPCGGAAQTYPDPRTCCPLGGPASDCHAAPADAGTTGSGSGTGSGGGSACVYPCPPTFVEMGAACCPLGATGSGACIVPATATACSSICNCPAELPDAGQGGCTCATPTSCQALPPPSCGPCPAGWQVPEGEPGLCCEEAPSGVIACFAQAVPPPPVVDAGAPDASVPPPSCVCNDPTCPVGAPCPAIPCECDGGSGEADAIAPPPVCVCSVPACIGDAPCAPVPCECDGGSGGATGVDAGSGGEVTCVKAQDCTGPVPALAERCSDGGYASGHWTCVDKACQLAFCE